MVRIFASILRLIPIALTLAACDPVSMLATGATVVSVIQTEETLTDKAVSWALNTKCSIFQAARGEDYCQSLGPDLPTQYCYRNLGGVTCYSQPDPNASQEIAVFATPPKPAEPPAAGKKRMPVQIVPPRHNPVH